MVTVPKIIRAFYPDLIWQKNEQGIFLTFDDGPHPGITPAVLKILKDSDVKATFFCVGDNVKKYPDIYKNIIDEGHKTGNHTFNHLNGWKTPTEPYIDNVLKADNLIDSKLFRPPYGKIKRSQIKELKKDFDIIMWSVLTYDFSKKTSPEKCFKNSLKGLKDGSIIVFHDNIKADKNLFYALPRFIKAAKEQGFEFKTL